MSRRFQFSLRAMLLVIALVAAPAAWFAQNTNLVRQRKQLLDQRLWHFGFSLHEVGVDCPDPEIPWIRRTLGDRPVSVLFYEQWKDTTGEELKQVEALFPEAKTYGWPRYPLGERLPAGMSRWKGRYRLYRDHQ
jgi:hypothetical protein